MDTKRFLTGLIVGFSALFILLAGGLWFLAGVMLIIFFGAKEYTQILKNKGFLPSMKIISISAIMFAIIFCTNKLSLTPLVFTISTLMAFMCVLFKGRQPYIANVATNMLGIVYCAWFPLHLILIRDMGTETIGGVSYPEGACYTILILLSVVAADTFCYFIGSKFGKHKLSTVISPNKTIEGAIGGTVMCVIIATVIGIAIGLVWYHAVILGILIATFAQLGDLCESMIKRDAGVKDSSNILPGHGGFLDRVDSYILTIPVVYYYLFYFVNNNIIDLFKGLF